MSNYINAQEESLFCELTDQTHETMDNLQTLIDCNWDSKTVKIRLERLVKDHWVLWDEIDLNEKKFKEDKN